MASWTSLALLSALVVSALSLPRPDESAYKIPQVGTGRRSQYYVLHEDGTFKYGHDTGEGAYETSRLHHQGRQEGQFGYRDPDGNLVSLQYEAGEGGFRPTGSHIPQPHPDFFTAHAEARARPPFIDPLADSNADASYSFNFAEDGLARQEQSDADGNVRGSYTYTDEEGRTRTYNYIAGRDTGFVVQGDDLPQAPLAPGATPAATSLSVGAGASSAFRASSSATSSHRPSSSTTSSFRPSSFSTSSFRPSSSTTSTAGFTSSTSPRRTSHGFTRSSTTGAGFTSNSETRPDGSYSFAYDAGDSSRSEAADANLNVDGQFSFVADDGVRRQVTYEAGSDTGFVATGDHLPRAPTSPHASGSSHRASARTSTSQRTSAASRPSTSHFTSAASQPSAFHRTSAASQLSTLHRPSRPSTSSAQSQFTSTGFASTRQSGGPVEIANTRSTLNPDGSYAFEYETSSHSRAEAGDSSNNVDGNFDFVADDGQRRGIQYEAGSDTGFIAEGAHIPVGPPVPGAPSGQPTGRIVPVQEIPFIDPLADSNADASYSFGFESEQYSRSETADADGNVQGTYTVVEDDGNRHTYRFRAGEGVGYEVEEVSSSSGPAPSHAAAQAGATSSFSSTGGVTTRHSAGADAVTSYSAPSSTSHSQAGIASASHRSSASDRTSAFHRTSPFQRASAPHRTSPSHRASAPHRTSISHTDGFQLRQYGASENRGKYGYVLTFDN